MLPIVIGSVEHKTFIVNKLFEVSDNDPIGVAVAWSSDFMWVLLETIIKEFRKSIQKERKQTLWEYVNSFISYLQNSEYIASISSIDVLEHLTDILIKLLENKIETEVKKEVDDPIFGKKLIDEQVEILTNKSKDAVKAGLNDILLVLEGRSWEIKGLEGIGRKNILSTIAKQQDKLNSIFCVPWSEHFTLFLRVILLSLEKDMLLKNFTSYSQLIFFWFWELEFTPRVKTISLFRKLEEHIVLVEEENIEITDGFIEPYAQWEDVRTSILGIWDATVHKIGENLDKNLQNLKENNIQNENQVKEIREAVKKSLKIVRSESHSSLMDTVRYLSKSELGKIAESFVWIGSMKKRMNMWYETIWGPIDVAIVTKADWFIRIKRKYYFTPELNYNYFNRLIWKNERNNTLEEGESS